MDKVHWYDGVDAVKVTASDIAYINSGITVNVVENRIEALENKLKPKDVPEETRTKLTSQNKQLVIKYYKDGYYQREKILMPDIEDVKVNHNVVFVYFTDKTFTKAVFDEEDMPFCLEQGISICLTKKMLGEHGSSLYNKLIQKALNVKQQKEREAQETRKKHEENTKKLEKAKKQQAKRKAKKREETITMYAEAFERALAKWRV